MFKNTVILIHLILIIIPNLTAISKNPGTDAVSSATCPAVKRVLPSGISINIDGKVQKKYSLTHEYLSTLSTVRVRTREITPEGNIMGAYIMEYQFIFYSMA